METEFPRAVEIGGFVLVAERPDEWALFRPAMVLNRCKPTLRGERQPLAEQVSRLVSGYGTVRLGSVAPAHLRQLADALDAGGPSPVTDIAAWAVAQVRARNAATIAELGSRAIAEMTPGQIEEFVAARHDLSGDAWIVEEDVPF